MRGLMLVVLAGIASGGAAAPAQTSAWRGRYAGALEGGRGRLVIRPAGEGRYAVNLAVSQPRCVGGVSGVASSVSPDTLLLRTAPDDDGEVCQVVMRRVYKGVDIQESLCGAYHGGECGFDGSLLPSR